MGDNSLKDVKVKRRKVVKNDNLMINRYLQDKQKEGKNRRDRKTTEGTASQLFVAVIAIIQNSIIPLTTNLHK